MNRSRSRVIFLDANVVMYAAGTAHPLREPCRRSLDRAVEEDIPLVTSVEVLQEILHRYVSIRRPEAAGKIYSATIRLCRAVLPVVEGHTARALELLLAGHEITARDAIHAATMEAHGLRRILSADRHFDLLDTIERLDPRTFAPGR